MIGKGTKIYSIVTSTCPACQNAKMWEYHAYKFGHLMSMKHNCPACNTNLEPEPSFYTGAMYVGYAMSVAIVLGVFIASNVLFDDPNITIMSCFSIGIAILFAPMNLRLSRNIWVNTFIHYKKPVNA